YRDVIKTGGTNPDRAARTALCITALQSPNFWHGNPGKPDILRKMALNIARRLPTFAEFDKYIKGELSESQYFSILQSEPGYLATVASWHGTWLDSDDLFKQVHPWEYRWRHLW